MLENAQARPARERLTALFFQRNDCLGIIRHGNDKQGTTMSTENRQDPTANRRWRIAGAGVSAGLALVALALRPLLGAGAALPPEDG